MIEHAAMAQLNTLTRQFPAVAILGPRQAGKTTLAFQLACKLRSEAVYVDLELPSAQAKLADPELYFSNHLGHMVILDLNISKATTSW